jgi:LAO/AO transport system kinase
MWNLIDSGLRHYFRQHPTVRADLPALIMAVAEARTTPGAAAQHLLSCLKQ